MSLVSCRIFHISLRGRQRTLPARVRAEMVMVQVELERLITKELMPNPQEQYRGPPERILTPSDMPD
jgi:hypothetical protein